LQENEGAHNFFIDIVYNILISLYNATWRGEEMSLKTYALRLDEEVYEGIKKELEAYGDPDLSISFIVRRYLRDLYEALPQLKKSDYALMNNITFWGTMLKHVRAIAQFENLLKGEPIVERAEAGVDDKKQYWKHKKERAKEVKNAKKKGHESI
jgi:hypothetical protein